MVEREPTTEEEKYRGGKGVPALRAPTKHILECLVQKGALTKEERTTTSKGCVTTITRYYIVPEAYPREPKPKKKVYLVSNVDTVCEPPRRSARDVITFTARDATLTYKLAMKYGCNGYYEE